MRRRSPPRRRTGDERGCDDGRPTAPPAPGRLGEAIPAGELLAYLEGVRRWRDARRQELERVDAAALASPDADAYTSDVTLAMSMWQGISDRIDELVRVWDSGRVARAEREQLSRLIWGRLEQSAQGSGGVSLVEAVRLCDALVASLHARLAFDPRSADVSARVAAVRAGLYRCGETVAQQRNLPGNPAERVDLLRRRLDDLAQRAAAGADVSGPFAVLETDAARLERDLIVAAAGQRSLQRDRAATQARRDELERQEDVLRELAERCIRAVAAPPRLGLPDPEALGEVPHERKALDAYRDRLERVAAAIAFAESAFAKPIAERDALRGRLYAYESRAARSQVAGGSRGSDPVVGLVHQAAKAVLAGDRVNLAAARGLLEAYGALITDDGAG